MTIQSRTFTHLPRLLTARPSSNTGDGFVWRGSGDVAPLLAGAGQGTSSCDTSSAEAQLTAAGGEVSADSMRRSGSRFRVVTASREPDRWCTTTAAVSVGGAIARRNDESHTKGIRLSFKFKQNSTWRSAEATGMRRRNSRIVGVGRDGRPAMPPEAPGVVMRVPREIVASAKERKRPPNRLGKDHLAQFAS